MLAKVTAKRIVPVVVLNDASWAEGLAQALVDGGLPVAEITFRTAAAQDAIRAMAQRPDFLVGAGTVLTPEQVDQAADAGAQFIVSPGFRPDVVERALGKNLAVLPGTVTPSEIMAAQSLGLDTVKFFPAGVYGGVKAIKALSAPFRGVSFVPTGGVTAENMGEYLAVPCIPAVGGSWMVPADKINAGDFEAVTQLVRDAVTAAAAG